MKASVPIQSSNMYSEHIFSPTFLRQVLLLKCSLPNDVIFILISLVLKYTYNYCTKYLFSIMHPTSTQKRLFIFYNLQEIQPSPSTEDIIEELNHDTITSLRNFVESAHYLKRRVTSATSAHSELK